MLRVFLLIGVLLLSFASQVEAAPTCNPYVESGAWVYRFNEWTL